MANDPTIKFKADTKQLKTAKRDLDNVKKSAFGAGKAANDASGGVRRFGGSLGSAAKSSMGLKVGLVALTGVAVKMLSTFATAEKGQMRLDALFKSTGGTAGFTSKRINELSEEIGRNTLQSAEGMRDAAGALMSFRAIGGKAFEDTIRLSADLSAVMGTDARGSALQLGKALEDPKNGLTMLRRAGISFTDSQKDMIFNLQKSGDLMGAQGAVIKILQGQFGGAGEAEGKGLAGAVDLVGENFAKFSENLMEASGIAKISTSIMNGLGEALGFMAGGLDEPTIAEDQSTLAGLKSKKSTKETRHSNFDSTDIDKEIKQLEDSINARLLADKKAEDAATAHQDNLTKIAVDANIVKMEQEHNAHALQIAMFDQRRLEAEGKELEAAQASFAIKTAQIAEEARIKAEADGADLERIQEQAIAKTELEIELHELKLEDIRVKKQEERDVIKEEDDKALKDELKFQAGHGSIVAKAKLVQLKLDKLTGKQRQMAQKKEAMAGLAFLGQNSEKAFKLHKALSLGSAIVQTATGVTDALKIQDYSGAARVALMGAQEIATIKSTTFSGGGSGGGSSGGGGSSAASVADTTAIQPEIQETIIEAPQAVNVTIDGSIDPSGARRIIEAINEATQDGLEINALVGS